MRFVLALSLVLTVTVSTAQTTSLIAEEGLTEAETQFAALPSKTPNDQFALGAIRFLRGIEKTLQLRWQHNMVLEDLDLPVLRLPMPPNPDAKPFDPALITNLFRELLTDMDASRTALAAIPDGADVTLDIDLRSLWFDINTNGVRDMGESVIEVGASTLMGEPDMGDSKKFPSMEVRFDTADVFYLHGKPTVNALRGRAPAASGCSV